MTNYFWLSDQILTGGGGNPNLDPYESSNYNASLEWYFAPRAILAAEVFYKDIGNYILQSTAPEDYFNQRSEEHTSELQSLMRISYDVFCLTTKKNTNKI